MHDEQIAKLIERFSQALSNRDFQEISNYWTFPALTFRTTAQERLPSQARSRRILNKHLITFDCKDSSPQLRLERIEMLSEKLAAVDVYW